MGDLQELLAPGFSLLQPPGPRSPSGSEPADERFLSLTLPVKSIKQAILIKSRRGLWDDDTRMGSESWTKVPVKVVSSFQAKSLSQASAVFSLCLHLTFTRATILKPIGLTNLLGTHTYERATGSLQKPQFLYRI